MNLSQMRSNVRRDLRDEDAQHYRWSDDELDRHIAHAVKDLSEAIPREQRQEAATTEVSRDIDISSLSDCIRIMAVEYPLGRFPKCYQRFSLWADTITLLGEEVPTAPTPPSTTANCTAWTAKAQPFPLTLRT